MASRAQYCSSTLVMVCEKKITLIGHGQPGNFKSERNGSSGSSLLQISLCWHIRTREKKIMRLLMRECCPVLKNTRCYPERHASSPLVSTCCLLGNTALISRHTNVQPNTEMTLKLVIPQSSANHLHKISLLRLSRLHTARPRAAAHSPKCCWKDAVIHQEKTDVVLLSPFNLGGTERNSHPPSPFTVYVSVQRESGPLLVRSRLNGGETSVGRLAIFPELFDTSLTSLTLQGVFKRVM